MGNFSANVVVLGGYLANEPEAKDLPKGEILTRFRLAINNGEADQAMFLTVAAFGKQAEACAEFLAKGSPVLVEGRLHQNNWETQNGEKRQAVEVRARRVIFLPRPRGPQGDHSSEVATG